MILDESYIAMSSRLLDIFFFFKLDKPFSESAFVPHETEWNMLFSSYVVCISQLRLP